MQTKVMCYNIHKGKSFFTRKRVFQEIKTLIQEVNADIVFLQEVRDYHEKDYEIYQQFQLQYLSSDEYHMLYGKNCEYKKGHHGNAILTKYPILESKNFDLSVNRLEQRGVLYNKLNMNGTDLYTFCTHLNLRNIHRQKQIRILEKIIELTVPDKTSPILLVGDFNDFNNEMEKYLIDKNFNIHGVKTFPNFFPMFATDKVFTKNITQNHTKVVKNKKLILLSDHLPLVSQLSL